jgi:UDP-N-acetylmuramoylalanine--D-glutamate ligase
MSDTRSEAQLAAARAEAPSGVERVVCGQPLLDPEGFDLVAVSQSVLRYDPALRRAHELGIEVTSQMRLFMQLCPGRLLGITGSSGKTTTTAMAGEMAQAAGIDAVVGGNIGEALLGRLDEIQSSTTVILEVSHTQLQYTDRSPEVAAVTNITPNHLDQFSWDEYVGLKRNLLSHQQSSDTAVLNADDQTSRALVPAVRGRLAQASMKVEVPGDGAWIEGNSVVARKGSRRSKVVQRSEIRLRGEHNVANVVMACAFGIAAGFPAEAMRTAIMGFGGVAHRLEVIGVAGGATWVNDSIATSPERTIAGVQAFREPVVLLLGGREKNLPLDRLQAIAKERCRAVVCFGESARIFADALGGWAPSCLVVDTMDEAVEEARRLVRDGDAVLLSPAATSFDAYPSFEFRGERFRRLVEALPGFAPAGPIGEVQR